MKINISCPACHKKLTVDPSLVGKKVQCPLCKSAFVVAAPDVQPETEQACPECGAELENGAVICTGCGLNLKTGQHLGG